MGYEVYGSKEGRTFKFDYDYESFQGESLDYMIEDFEFVTDRSRDVGKVQTDFDSLSDFIMSASIKDYAAYAELINKNTTGFAEDFNDYFNVDEDDELFLEGPLTPEFVQENESYVKECVAETQYFQRWPEIVRLYKYEGHIFTAVNVVLHSSSEGYFKAVGSANELRGEEFDGIVGCTADMINENSSWEDNVNYFSKVYFGNIFDVKVEEFNPAAQEWVELGWEECDDVRGPWTDDNDLEKIVSNAGYTIVPSPEGV